jgi:uncharacterized membrane protein
MKNIILVFIVFITYTSWSQIQVTNNTEEPIWFTYGYYSNTNSFAGWITVGWYEIIPGQTSTIGSFLKDGNNTYYYYAHNKSRTKTWGGDYQLAVNQTDAFKIVNADKDYVLNEDQGIVRMGFKEKKVFIGLFDLYKCYLSFE